MSAAAGHTPTNCSDRLTLALGVTCLSCATSCSRPESVASVETRSVNAAVTSPRAAPLASASEAAKRGDRAAFEERRTEREHMVRATIASAGVRDPRVLEVMRRVPRHRFVPDAVRSEAYADHPLPIGWGQTISQPFIVAFMTEAVAPTPSDRCLEIGTGSGYQAAVLAELCKKTYSIEYVPELARFARENLTALGYAVELRTGDGFHGWPEAAPFDVIVVTAAPEEVPEPLLDQLALGGRLVIPVGEQRGSQKLALIRRKAAGNGALALERRELADVRFVPFLGGEDRR